MRDFYFNGDRQEKLYDLNLNTCSAVSEGFSAAFSVFIEFCCTSGNVSFQLSPQEGTFRFEYRHRSRLVRLFLKEQIVNTLILYFMDICGIIKKNPQIEGMK